MQEEKCFIMVFQAPIRDCQVGSPPKIASTRGNRCHSRAVQYLHHESFSGLLHSFNSLPEAGTFHTNVLGLRKIGFSAQALSVLSGNKLEIPVV